MVALGIDIGGTSVKLAAVENGTKLWTGQSPFYSRPTTAQLVDAIKQAAAGRIAKRVECAGVCVPGLLDPEKRMVTLSVNVPGLMGVVLDDLVCSALGDKIAGLKIINDAVASATDVILSRNLRGRVMSLALGTGVGVGVLDDGVPLTVEGASPGHIGQADVSVDDANEQVPIGPDGGAGSLEAYIGVPALVARYRSMERFFREVKASDVPMRALARAIRICHAIYRPHHVVLNGGVGTRLKHVVLELKSLVDRDLTSVARSNWTLSTGDHDFHAAMGAARLANPSANPGEF
jgi:predicted NBD/HSP70 family sugar kinase